jgi:protein-tyrosine phosphatase
MDFIYYFLIFILFLILIMLFSTLYLSLTNKLHCLDNKNINYNKIIDHLYIGNIVAAQDLSFIKNNNINVIINCSNDIPNYHVIDNNIEYHRIPIDDSLEEYDINLMSELLPKYVKIINNAISEKKNVLVHCYAGRQRSACLIAAYLIFKYNYTIEEAYKIILSKRKQVFHYGKAFNFNKSLINYQNNLLKV